MLRSVFSAFAALCLLCAGILPMNAAELFPSFNTRLATQTFSPKYQFTTQTRLVETAEQIYALGSDTIKFGMGTTQDQTYLLPPLSQFGITTLTGMARDEPSYRHVFDMPFRTFIFWAYPLTVPGSVYHPWRDGVSVTESTNEYNEIYSLTRYLLQTYNGTGKTFMMGHWEGDWALIGATVPTRDPTAVGIQGMIDWLKIRQKAIDDAKANTPHNNVYVWQYSEVNLVDKAIAGSPTVTNSVLPNVTIDLVSYSAYDTIFTSPAAVTTALDYIAGKAHLKGPYAKNIFIGEYGFPTDRGATRTPQEQADLTRGIYQAALGWGCPFALYWQMYDNEASEGGADARGFWLIDYQNQRQPTYDDHQDFLGRANMFKNMYRFWLQRNPGEGDFSNFSLYYRQISSTSMLSAILDSAEYKSLVSDQAYALFLYSKLCGINDPLHAEVAQAVLSLQQGMTRMNLLKSVLNSSRFAFLYSNLAFARMLARGPLQQPLTTAATQTLIQTLLQRLNSGTARADLWLEQLDSTTFYNQEFPLRGIDEKNSITIFQKYFINTQFGLAPSARAANWLNYL
jgi:hypothetical protein